MTTQKKLFENLVNELTDSVKKTKSLVSKHAPDVAKEVIAKEMVTLKYNIAQYVIGTCIGLIMLGVGIVAFNYAISFEWNWDGTNGPQGRCVAGLLIGAIGVIIATVNGSISIDQLSQLNALKVAPKVAVLNYLKTLVFK